MAGWRTPAIVVIFLAAAGLSLAILARGQPNLTPAQTEMRAATQHLPVREGWRRQPNDVFDARLRTWRKGEEIAPRHLPLFDNNADGALSRRDVLFVRHLEIEGGRSGLGRVEIGPGGAERIWLGRRTPVKVVARETFGIVNTGGRLLQKTRSLSSPRDDRRKGLR